VGWYADFIMPDILGPVLYLAIYLLVFAPETLGRAERVGLYLIAWWAVTAHASHLLLAGLLLVLLALYAAVARKGFGGRMRALGRVAAIVALAAGAQMALHGYLYGQPSLNGERPPYLMARLVADGPGRWYLQKHCPQLQWVVCAHLKELTGDPDDFLWGPDGAYETVSNEERPIRGSNWSGRERTSWSNCGLLGCMGSIPARGFCRSSTECCPGRGRAMWRAGRRGTSFRWIC